MTEKTVAVIRASLADLYLPELRVKIRHFYDLHHLLKDSECRKYLYSGAFTDDFMTMLTHDRQTFDKPAGWRTRQLKDSPLITNLPQIWSVLAGHYIHEMPDLAYNPLPKPDEVGQSIQELIRVLNER
ncbi:MAG: nucleotidyl transferase AbiEii/AbiGii toxin family protein [Prevotella sp.]|nr:nucleotidyl transferase AbiEii/AbiGii toxin family protein [Prevotella sp.]